MDPAQKGQLALVLRQGQDGHAAHLGHGLDEQNAGHDVLLGEVALEKGLVDGDAFDAPGPLARLAVHDAVYQGKGIPVGKNFRDLIGIVLHTHAQPSHFLKRIVPLWPPKPRELDRAYRRSAFRPWFGTTSRSHSSSGSR